jgi:hypothetical protein
MRTEITVAHVQLAYPTSYGMNPINPAEKILSTRSSDRRQIGDKKMIL